MIFFCPTFTFSSSSLLSSSLRLGCGDLFAHEPVISRVLAVVRDANKNCDFAQLCCEYPMRLCMLKEKEGDRLRK